MKRSDAQLAPGRGSHPFDLGDCEASRGLRTEPVELSAGECGQRRSDGGADEKLATIERHARAPRIDGCRARLSLRSVPMSIRAATGAALPQSEPGHIACRGSRDILQPGGSECDTTSPFRGS